MSSHKNRKVCFISPYPFDTAPGQRFRYEQYIELLKAQGFTIQYFSFLSLSDYQILYTKGNSIKKTLAVIKGFIKRIGLLFTLSSVNYVFIFREASPVGPPVFEWIIAYLLQKKIIYDFDDAIWLTDKTEESLLEKGFRWRTKVGLICKWSYKVSTGNEYLCNYALQFNNHVVLNPTTVDTERIHNPALYQQGVHYNRNNDHVIIGWTGSHSTLKYLKHIESALQKLEATYSNIRFLIIADRGPDLNLQRIDFLPWNKKTEAADLLKMDIGIMPLPDDEWTKGKCGFKALQYMAMEIPAVVSGVGVNVKIIDHEKNGFHSSTPEEWFIFLSLLIENESLRKKMGISGRKKVIENYSVSSNTPTFLSLFS